jgi:hypothetical protein
VVALGLVGKKPTITMVAVVALGALETAGQTTRSPRPLAVVVAQAVI